MAVRGCTEDDAVIVLQAGWAIGGCKTAFGLAQHTVVRDKKVADKAGNPTTNGSIPDRSLGHGSGGWEKSGTPHTGTKTADVAIATPAAADC